MVQSLSRRRLAAASLLAAIAGYLDGFGFVFLGGHFVSFMSGNTTRAAVDLSTFSLAGAAFGLLLVATFVAGAMAGTVMPGDGMRGATRVLVMIVILVCIAAITAGLDWRWPTGGVLAFAMGAMNTVFGRGEQVSFGVTYMTGALVKLAQGLVRSAQGQRGTGWGRHLAMWASIAVGAVPGAAALAAWGSAALWIVAGLLAMVLVIPGLRVWLHI